MGTSPTKLEQAVTFLEAYASMAPQTPFTQAVSSVIEALEFLPMPTPDNPFPVVDRFLDYAAHDCCPDDMFDIQIPVINQMHAQCPHKQDYETWKTIDSHEKARICRACFEKFAGPFLEGTCDMEHDTHWLHPLFCSQDKDTE